MSKENYNIKRLETIELQKEILNNLIEIEEQLLRFDKMALIIYSISFLTILLALLLC